MDEFVVTVGETPELTPPLYFIERSTTPSVGPEGEGWHFADVWFDRPGADELVRRHESKRTWVEQDEVSDLLVTVARVLSAAELVERDGLEALARVLMDPSMQVTMRSRLALFEVGGLRIGEANPSDD